jgi:hypothetical protein
MFTFKNMHLDIYMKSGNKITIDRVTSWDIRYDEDQVTHIAIGQVNKGLFKCKNKLIVGSIDLKQIECIVER